MTTFDERSKGYEGAAAHQADMDFVMEAKTCKYFGLWLAEHLGLNGAEADTYAKQVISANLEEPGFYDVLRKVKPDLAAKNVNISDEELNKALDDAMMSARKEIEK